MYKSPMSVVNQGREAVEEYWKERLNQMKVDVKALEDSEGVVDSTLSSIVELVELAVSLKQYERPYDLYSKTKRIVRLRMDISKSTIEKDWGMQAVGVYGIGLYVVVDGLLLSGAFRDKSNFDYTHRKGVRYDLSDIPEELQKEYEFGLSIPAFEGIFVPKKSLLTSYAYRSGQLQFFDLSL